MQWQVYGDGGDAARALAGEVVAALRTGLGWRERGSLALAGGRTPVPLLRALRDAELDWSRVAVTLTDERCVPERDAASNAALVRRELLCGRAGAAHLVPLVDADNGAALWNDADFSRAPLAQPFDAVVLGMGEDGHFASLFPGSPGLAAALDPAAAPACVPMRAGTAPVERVSLNLAALLQTRRLFLLVGGAAKRQLLEAALAEGTQAPGVDAWPVRALLAQQVRPLEIYWSP